MIGSLLVTAGSLVAAPLPAGAIPGETRWVIHLNVDAARGTALWELLRTKFVEPRREELTPKVAAIENITGTKLPRDLHDVTLFGVAFDEATLGLLIHAPINEERVTAILKLDPEFRSSDHNGHALLTWRDKDRDRLMYASFLSGELVVLSPSAKTVATVLDTFDGKAPALKEPRLLPPGAGAGGAATRPATMGEPVLWLASTHVSELPRRQAADSPFLVKVDSASLGVGLSAERLWARAAADATDEKAAQQLSAAADGLKAMVLLAASDDRANARVRMLANALQNLTITRQGLELSADWSIGMESVDAILELVRPAPARPATTNLAAPAPASPAPPPPGK
jgi:hypothetical protein